VKKAQKAEKEKGTGVLPKAAAGGSRHCGKSLDGSSTIRQRKKKRRR